MLSPVMLARAKSPLPMNMAVAQTAAASIALLLNEDRGVLLLQFIGFIEYLFYWP
jgi:hypothetical protein